jgi:hypothetical protein
MKVGYRGGRDVFCFAWHRPKQCVVQKPYCLLASCDVWFVDECSFPPRLEVPKLCVGYCVCLKI